MKFINALIYRNTVCQNINEFKKMDGFLVSAKQELVWYN